jgi:hypothetical protein
MSWDPHEFRRMCREADNKQRRKPADPRLEKLRRLMADDISLERAWHEFNPVSGQPKNKPCNTSILSTPPIDGVSAADIAERIRPSLADSSRSTKERIRILWAAAKAARHVPDVSAVFMALAVETNLIDRRGRWTGEDVRADVRRHGAEDVEHVITWALRGWNPFEKGPLK